MDDNLDDEDEDILEKVVNKYIKFHDLVFKNQMALLVGVRIR